MSGGHRPPWWPEGEPFPPPGRREWRGQWRHGGPPGAPGAWPPRGRIPRRFVRRMGLYFAGTIVVLTAVGTAAVWLAANVLGMNGAPAPLRLGSLVLLVVVFVLMGGGGRMVRGFARPVADLVDAAQRIEEGDLSVRVAERGPREVRAVARAFNAMTTELEATDARRRQFLADITHELRTPLSVIRGRAEGIVDGVYPGDAEHVAPVLEAARTLELLIEDLRTLAMAESGGLTLRRERVDIGLLLHETATLLAPVAMSRGVRLEVDVAPDLPTVDVDPARIQSVLSNLVTNGLRHTPAGGAVTLAAMQSQGDVAAQVTDTGEGIDPELLPFVFDRFVKGSGSPGSGLGLAIARDLVVAHGGRIEATAGPGGAGTTVRFTLPAHRGL